MSTETTIASDPRIVEKMRTASVAMISIALCGAAFAQSDKDKIEERIATFQTGIANTSVRAAGCKGRPAKPPIKPDRQRMPNSGNHRPCARGAEPLRSSGAIPSSRAFRFRAERERSGSRNGDQRVSFAGIDEEFADETPFPAGCDQCLACWEPENGRHGRHHIIVNAGVALHHLACLRRDAA